MEEVTICYGMTETSPVSTQTAAERPAGEARGHRRARAPARRGQGRRPGDGRVVEREQPGELCTRGYSVMLGYWDDEERTDEALDRARWMHTGDLAVMDDEGYLRIVGRIKDMVIRGGENVYPREIEEFLYGHPDIADVQVMGVPDPRFGEELMAWIVPRGGADVDAGVGGRVLPRQDRPLQGAALRCSGRRVPDDGHRQGAEVQAARAARSSSSGSRRRVETASMCGRYTLTTPGGRALTERFDVGEEPEAETLQRFNVCPTEQIAAVSASRASGERASDARAALGADPAVGAGAEGLRADQLPLGDGRHQGAVRRAVRAARAPLPDPRRRLVRVAEVRGQEGRPRSRSATRSTAARRSRSPACGAGAGSRAS